MKSYYKSFHDLYKYTIECEKEIERLNNDIKELLKENENKEKVIKAQDSIINELEKDIKNLYTYGIKNNAEQRDYLLNRLEGLKELKGSNEAIPPEVIGTNGEDGGLFDYGDR